MKDGRIHLRVDGRLKAKVTRIAEQRGVTLSDLTTQYFQKLVEEDEERRKPVDAEQI